MFGSHTFFLLAQNAYGISIIAQMNKTLTRWNIIVGNGKDGKKGGDKDEEDYGFEALKNTKTSLGAINSVVCGVWFFCCCCCCYYLGIVA